MDEYQGIVIIADPREGPCIIKYEPGQKGDYDRDVERDKVNNCRIMVSEWLDEPTTDSGDGSPESRLWKMACSRAGEFAEM